MPEPANPSTPDLTLYSFGFKHGIPLDANFLWDVRFLPNPYWEDSLRSSSGQDQMVADYVVDSDVGQSFLSLIEPLLLQCLEANRTKEKKGLRCAIGCTGGRHRSVAVVESLSRFLQDKGYQVRTLHRDIAKEQL